MRLVTWNINGLASLRWPLNIHAHHTHRYPQPDAHPDQRQPVIPHDDYDILDSEKQSLSTQPPPANTVADKVEHDPRSAFFPAFPASKLVLTPHTVSDYAEFLDYFCADIICLQEVKIGRSRLDLLSKAAYVRGYDAYFSFCRKRAGYSGVVTYIRQRSACPVAAEEGVSGTLSVINVTPNAPSHSTTSIGHNTALLSHYTGAEIRDLDTEGRCVITDHGSFVLFNLYVPNAGEDREDFKLKFLALLEYRVSELLAAGRQVVLVGDLNIAGARLDHCGPEPYKVDDSSTVPFEQSPSRRWLHDRLTVNGGQFDDLMRMFYPHQRHAYTVWNNLTGAREGNWGTRIDYVLASHSLTLDGHFTDCRILPHVEGSDHCPVQCDIDDTVINRSWLCGVRPPALASCYWTEFCGKQKSLKSFFSAAATDADTDNHLEETVAVAVSARSSALSQSQTNGTKRKKETNSVWLASTVTSKKQKKSTASAKPSIGKASLLTYFKQPTPAPVTIPEPMIVSQSAPLTQEVMVIDDENQSPKSNSTVEPVLSPPSSSPSSATSADTSWFQRLQRMNGATLSLNCSGHNVPCKRFTVNKKGANNGREFYCCAVPPPDRCKFWIWAADARAKQKRKLEFEERQSQSPQQQRKEFASAKLMLDTS